MGPMRRPARLRELGRIPVHSDHSGRSAQAGQIQQASLNWLVGGHIPTVR